MTLPELISELQSIQEETPTRGEIAVYNKSGRAVPLIVADVHTLEGGKRERS